MAHKFIPFYLLFFVTSCGVVKNKTSYNDERKITVAASSEVLAEPGRISPGDDLVILPAKVDIIIDSALKFSGVPYQFGGITRNGMDCSGLLYASFLEHDVALPRSSYEMADEGKRIRLNEVMKGDLLFFKTSNKATKINHVGLVVDVDGDDIKFIHSTSSRGVIVSSLREGFWNYAFVKATRIL